jgi:hypothetical protein
MTKVTHVEIIPGADPKEAIDVVVSKIAKEKRYGSNGFDDTGGVCGRTSDGGD